MPVVTAIEPHSRRGGRFTVSLDGRVVGLVSLDSLDRLGLRTGVALAESDANALEREVACVAAYDRALAMLAVRARAGRELRLALRRKGEAEFAIDYAIERLTAAGFLDDAAYARQFARAKILGARLSRRRVESELIRRGVPRDMAVDAISEVVDEERVDADSLIEDAARRKVRSLGSVAPEVARRRLYAFLARRGFAPDEIRRVVDRLTPQRRA
jgi:regulatory protein